MNGHGDQRAQADALAGAAGRARLGLHLLRRGSAPSVHARQQQRPEDEEHDQHRGDLERLGLDVEAGPPQGPDVENGRGANRRRQRHIAAAQPPPGREAEGDQPDQRKQLPGVEAELAVAEQPLAAGPDPERLRRGHRIAQLRIRLEQRAGSALVDEALDARQLGDREHGEDHNADQQQRRRRADPGPDLVHAPVPVCEHELGQRPDPGGAREPGQAGIAVGGDRAGGEGGRRPDQRELALLRARQLAQDQRECHQEEPDHHLLEPADAEGRGGQVGDRDQHRGDRALHRRQLGEQVERGEGRDHGDRDQQAEEPVERLGAEGLRDRRDHPVGADRVAEGDPAGHRAGRVLQPVGEDQVRGHVVVDADPGHAQVARGDERDRGREQAEHDHGRGDQERLAVGEREPQVGDRADQQDRAGDQGQVGTLGDRARVLGAEVDPGQDRADDQQHGEADGGLQPVRLAAAEQGEEGPADVQRGDDDQQR